MAHYLDTSALVKLVIAQPESPALRAWLSDTERALVSSDLARTELLRAVARVNSDRVVLARAVLDSVVLLRIDTATYDTAGRLSPSHLSCLDAVHLAAALTLGDELETMVTYDDRLAAAAQVNGVSTTAPA